MAQSNPKAPRAQQVGDHAPYADAIAKLGQLTTKRGEVEKELATVVAAGPTDAASSAEKLLAGEALPEARLDDLRRQLQVLDEATQTQRGVVSERLREARALVAAAALPARDAAMKRFAEGLKAARRATAELQQLATQLDRADMPRGYGAMFHLPNELLSLDARLDQWLVLYETHGYSPPAPTV